MNKINVIHIARDHFKTLYDDRRPVEERGLSAWDFATFVGIPIALGALTWLVAPDVYDLGSLITATSVFAGFMFAALILVLESGLILTDGELDIGKRRRLRLLKEVRANVAWTTILAVTTAGFLGLADLITVGGGGGGADPNPVSYPVWYLIVGVVLLSHLFLTLIMVVKRLYMVLGAEADQRQVNAGV